MSIETEITKLVMREARLLDEWQLDDWLELLAEDGIYWLPIDEKADPQTTSSIIHENRQILAMRVEQLMREDRHSQTPRSEIMRCVTNLDVTEEPDGMATARYNLLAIETRSGDWRQKGMGEKRLFAGRTLMRFRKESAGWRMVLKRVILLDRQQPIVGLSFIL
jgi:3-phenylpropionate/cinnamic acid dioxygenase small subunit